MVRSAVYGCLRESDFNRYTNNKVYSKEKIERGGDTTLYYYLDNNFNVVKARSTEEWMEHWDILERRVAEHQIGAYRISTVFLGLNHGHYGKPLFFETMVFDEDHKDVYMERYTTWDEATAGHNRIVEYIRTGGKETDANMDNK